MSCDVAAAWPDLGEMIAAAACAPPVEERVATLLVSQVRVPASEGIGTVHVRGADLWVAVDGAVVGPASTVPAGPHLLQVGEVGRPVASAAAIVVVPPDGAEVVRLALLEDGARSYTCDDVDTWLLDLWDAGHREGVDVHRLGALDTSFADCRTPPDPFAVGTTVAEAGARVGSPSIAQRGASLAAAVDPPRWDGRQLVARRTTRAGSLGVAAGLGVVALGVQQDLHTDGRVPAGPFVVGGTALVLGSGCAQHSALAKAGAPVTLQAAGVGLLFLSTAVLFGEISAGLGDGYAGTMLTSGALGLGVVQAIENESALARGRTGSDR